MQEGKSVSGVDGVPTTVMREAIPVTFRVDVPSVDLALVRQEYNEYRRPNDDRSEAERAEASDDVRFDTVFQNDFLWTEPGDGGGVTKKALLAVWSPSAAVG